MKRKIVLSASVVLIITTMGFSSMSKNNSSTPEPMAVAMQINDTFTDTEIAYEEQEEIREIESVEVQIEEEIELERPHSDRGEIDRIPILLDLPYGIDTNFKAYMNYNLITDKTSKQYKIKQSSWTDWLGFRRYTEGNINYYCVALGTYYSPEAGLKFRIGFDTGEFINVITGDIKNPKHVDSTNRYHTNNGNLLEFLIDEAKIMRKALRDGDLSVNFDFLKGQIISIEKLGE